MSGSSPSPQLRREISGIALLVFAVFLAGALATLALANIQAGVDVRESVGPVGVYLAYPLVWLVGWPAAAMAPFAPAVHALRVFGRLESSTDRKWMMFFAGVVVLVALVTVAAFAPTVRNGFVDLDDEANFVANARCPA